MKRCAYLTMSNPGNFVTDYDVSFGAIYICTPWDYPQHTEEFMRVLETIEYSSAHLINEPSLYLSTDTGAADRFARAFDQRFQILSGK